MLALPSILVLRNNATIGATPVAAALEHNTCCIESKPVHSIREPTCVLCGDSAGTLDQQLPRQETMATLIVIALGHCTSFTVIVLSVNFQPVLYFR